MIGCLIFPCGLLLLSANDRWPPLLLISGLNLFSSPDWWPSFFFSPACLTAHISTFLLLGGLLIFSPPDWWPPSILLPAWWSIPTFHLICGLPLFLPPVWWSPNRLHYRLVVSSSLYLFCSPDLWSSFIFSLCVIHFFSSSDLRPHLFYRDGTFSLNWLASSLLLSWYWLPLFSSPSERNKNSFPAITSPSQVGSCSWPPPPFCRYFTGIEIQFVKSFSSILSSSLSPFLTTSLCLSLNLLPLFITLPPSLPHRCVYP